MFEKIESFVLHKIEVMAKDFFEHADLNKDGKADHLQVVDFAGRVIAGGKKAVESVKLDDVVNGFELLGQGAVLILNAFDKKQLAAGTQEALIAVKEGYAFVKEVMSQSSTPAT